MTTSLVCFVFHFRAYRLLASIISEAMSLSRIAEIVFTMKSVPAFDSGLPELLPFVWTLRVFPHANCEVALPLVTLHEKTKKHPHAIHVLCCFVLYCTRAEVGRSLLFRSPGAVP